MILSTYSSSFFLTGVVPEFSEIGTKLAENGSLIGQYFVWLSVPFSALVSWIFNTMQRIGTAGENTFEGYANEAPITTMARGIEIDMREMIYEEKETIPNPDPMIYDVQT